MKLKTRVKLLLLSVAALVASLALFAGCKIGETTPESYLNGKGARDQQVTYYANGGFFDNTSNSEKNIYYKVGSQVIVDFDKVNNISVARTNYIFDGWYKVELDEDGAPVFEDEGKKVAKLTDEKVNPNDPLYIQEKEHLYFGAKWQIDVRLELILVTDDNQPITTADGVIECGQPVGYRNFGSQTTIQINNGVGPKDENGKDVNSVDYTFFEYYSDEACTQPFSGSVQKPAEGAGNPKIYAKYIKGKFVMVRSASDAQKMMFDLSGTSSYYICNDIDCAGIAGFSLWFNKTNLTIVGNGHSISNIAIECEIRNGDKASLFGTLGSSAKITGLTFKNIELTATVRPSAFIDSMHLFVTATEEGAQFESVAFENVSWKVTLPDTSTIGNIQNSGGDYDTSCWLFGGMTTDAAFLAEFDSVTVTNASLTMGPRNHEELIAQK